VEIQTHDTYLPRNSTWGIEREASRHAAGHRAHVARRHVSHTNDVQQMVVIRARQSNSTFIISLIGHHYQLDGLSLYCAFLSMNWRISKATALLSF